MTRTIVSCHLSHKTNKTLRSVICQVIFKNVVITVSLVMLSLTFKLGWRLMFIWSLMEIRKTVSTSEMSEEASNIKPKGRMSAYACYLKLSWEEHKEKNPDTTANYPEFARECYSRWETMTKEEKQKFVDMAEQDLMRYEKEILNFKRPRYDRERLRPRPSYGPDPKAPKRPMSSYFWFCLDIRPQIIEEHPKYSLTETAKELGRRWRELDPETKAKYDTIEAEDQARYDREVAEYKQRKK